MPCHDLTRRTALGALTAFALSGCALRLEDDSPLPGPKAPPAPDTRPLLAVRTMLLSTIAAAQSETRHRAESSAALTMHRAQLTRLDATLKGLGEKRLPTPSTTSTPAPTTSSSPASTAAPPSASPSSSPSSTPAATAWTAAEQAWASEKATATFARVSSSSRATAMAIGATGAAAAARAGQAPSWPSDADVPAQGAARILPPVESAIAAFEWIAAKTDADKRDDVTGTLTCLYAARSMSDAAQPSAPTSVPPAPVRSFTSQAAAKKAATTSLESLVPACAYAASQATTPATVSGLLMIWSGALGDLQALGVQTGPFPGLAETT